jgi:hypothetical protein
VLLCGPELNYNPVVSIILRKPGKLLLLATAWCATASGTAAAQAPPPASGARILLLPRKLVTGERATLAVLDVNGKLTPGVPIEFSNGDKITTDATGRAAFVAPLTPGPIFGSIGGRAGRVGSVVLAPADVPSATLEVSAVPRVASLSDRFEILGHGFCGDAGANHVTIGGAPGLVLASSPAYLSVVAPIDMGPGPAKVRLQCGQKTSAEFTVVFVNLELDAKNSTLAPEEHRTLLVRVLGTAAKISLEARNLAPEIAELSGGTVVKATSSGGAENTASFQLQGKQRGNFIISIRLLAPLSPPRN